MRSVGDGAIDSRSAAGVDAGVVRCGMLVSELLVCGASSVSFGFLSADSRVESAFESESESLTSLLLVSSVCKRLEGGVWMREDVPIAVLAETATAPAEAMSEEVTVRGRRDAR